MRISEVAQRAGVTTKAIRYYESLGLVVPARLGNGYRDYGEHDVRLVCEVRELIRLGIAAERTRPFLDCLTTGGDHGDDCPSSLAGYRDAIDDLTERIRALSERRTGLIDRLREAARRTGTATPELKETSVYDPYYLPANLPVPQDDGAADHLAGLPMPEIELAGTAGEVVGLHAMGTGRTVLYVYPLTGRPETDLPEGWDAIPGARGCTPQACDFRDHHKELVAAGAARVYGLSSQESAYQSELAERLRLPFGMLSDTGLRLADALGLPVFEAPGATLYKRLTLVVRDNVIEHVFYPVFPPNAHAQQVLAWLLANPA